MSDDMESPLGVKVHSTRVMSTLITCERGVSIDGIFIAATLS